MPKPTSLCKAYADFYIFSKSTCCLLCCFAGLLSLNKRFGGKLIGEVGSATERKSWRCNTHFPKVQPRFQNTHYLSDK